MVINGFLIGVLSSIAGGILVIVIQFLWRQSKENRSPYTGLWEDKIVDNQRNIIKKDHIHLRQRGNTVSGDIARIEPKDQNHRRWKLDGRIYGHHFFATFWPVDQSIPSYGCWYVYQDEDFMFDGYYLKMTGNKGEEIDKIPITIRRISHMK